MSENEQITRYNQALILSLGIHLLVYACMNLYPIYFANVASQDLEDETIEFEVVDPEDQKANKKKRWIVEDPEAGKVIDEVEDSKNNILSRFNRRVRRQQIARNVGPMKNRIPGVVLRQSKKDRSKKENRRKGEKGKGKKQRSKVLDLNGDIAQYRQNQQKSRGSNIGREILFGTSTTSFSLPNIKKGDITSLNTDQFTYYTFFYRVNKQIFPRWAYNLRSFASRLTPETSRRIGTSNRTTELEIVLDNKGQYLKTRVLRESGVRALDVAAIRAFKDAAPFLNPPKDLVKEDGTIRLLYRLELVMEPSFLATN